MRHNEPKIYKIPVNFREPGYFFNGMIAARNLIDACIMGAIGYFLASLMPFNEDMALSGYILFIGMFGMVGLSGIKDVPLSTFLVDSLAWKKRRRPYLYNAHGGAYTVSAADVMLQEEDFRDSVANILDKLRTRMAGKAPEYIEGVTFQFAADPELEALQEAEERIYEERNSTEQDTPAAASEPNPTQSAPQKDININEIVDGIKLNDLNGSGTDEK